ncbi:hypothetical protein C8R43DRAFT_1103764 [Mycena crocata]|nr:hypothetical protein C8R43DRAFT_1103764 [Mycena crocata]
MARIFFALMTVICMFHTLAAPLHRRAVTSKECEDANTASNIGITNAKDALEPINIANELFDRPLLQTLISLLDAQNGTSQIALALLNGGKPAPADAPARILAGLQAAQGSLGGFLTDQNSTKVAVATANAQIEKAVAAAQKAVDLKCVTTEGSRSTTAVLPATTAEALYGTMKQE